MGKESRKVTEEGWLICPNLTEVKSFTKNKNNKKKFFDYMLVDSVIVFGHINFLLKFWEINGWLND